MKSRSFTVVIYKEDDLYIAECPEVGTVDQGETSKQPLPCKRRGRGFGGQSRASVFTLGRSRNMAQTYRCFPSLYLSKLTDYERCVKASTSLFRCS